MNKDDYLIQRLSRSDLYNEFRQAFVAGTCLPLRLRPVNFWGLAHHGQPHENPFCALIAQTNRGRAACLETEQRAVDSAQDRPGTVRCFAGLCHTAAPVKLGNHTIGFLQTGQVALELTSTAGFEAITRQLVDWGVPVEASRLRDAYYRSTVLSPDQYSGLIGLLEIFAQQLSLTANRMMIQDAEAEAPMIRRAKAYIGSHSADPISLDDIARALYVSTFYFCKMFKKATGLTFTEYLARTRVERAKNLLLNPHLRVSEIAYSVGFQSLTHFNRRFHEFTGGSPTHFRDSATTRNKGMARNHSAQSSALRSLATAAMPLAA